MWASRSEFKRVRALVEAKTSPQLRRVMRNKRASREIRCLAYGILLERRRRQ